MRQQKKMPENKVIIDQAPEDELYEHYRFEAGKGQSPLRVDKFLMNLVENATRNKIQQAAAAGNIYVNDVPVKSNHKVKSCDVVRVLLEHPPVSSLQDTNVT